MPLNLSMQRTPEKWPLIGEALEQNVTEYPILLHEERYFRSRGQDDRALVGYTDLEKGLYRPFIQAE